MNKQNFGGPYTTLGKQLKTLRIGANETLAEVSGAVEIEVRQLANFELGQDRPSEDVLLLLISHFSTGDDEAVRLWEMAGYGISKIPAAQMASDQSPASQAVLLDETRVLFTDVVDIIVNNYGVVMNFMQSGGPNQPPTNVARVGMSREHAKSVLEILKITLDQTERSQVGSKPKTASENSPNNI